MAKQTSSECKYALVLGEPATYDAAGFAALTFVPVPAVDSIGAYGATYNEVEAMPLSSEFVETYKGSGRAGAVDISMYLDTADAGQILIASGTSGINRRAVFSHRITYQDGSIDYAVGQLFSATKEIGAQDSMVMRTVRVVFNKLPVEVAAP
jgi:phage tail tube protein FII